MKVIILCGGKGLRMQGILGNIPKPLVHVQGKPLIWHIMNWYSKFGHHEFVLPLGYGGEKIKEYFMDYIWKEHDFNLDLKNNHYQLLEEPKQWNIKFIDTGIETMTGTRLKKLEKHIQDEMFLLTYGDGLAKIDINELIKFHKDKGKIATLTGIKKSSQYGLLQIENGIAVDFKEKPLLNAVINGGFFVFNKGIFNYLNDNDCMLEEEPLLNLIKNKELAVYEHNDYWISVDTPKDLKDANESWNPNKNS
ncbi:MULTISPECIES: sugar phosphate nucleotidyltransferase [Bacillus]|uniref:sugar phosphate nucleotidyltransferase n=1 Tax=Bacillus TaxID=1386 RepID=UPI000303DF00|nr:sugar phosphate nucleotidyltransferase [Bacillus pseudomycoides]MEB3054866.1 sugar phosphate nucleotidyltransferase [Bacillus pseudomycoides]MED1596211.1 sugar phosphate nucleotidyltransferase [Bacillus pseudomycoides]MED4710008.1 sugar phosphate nucleotidyltransferase [Bacillus pseudomycoides]OOR54491.1 glucose-1-phosphate cytidylyltransferase [Bacillus pseudomycoides]PDY11796.1 glucose-1-phosphate cytidylyltransferase [Bacillus pseudomycoides]